MKIKVNVILHSIKHWIISNKNIQNTFFEMFISIKFDFRMFVGIVKVKLKLFIYT